MYKSLLTVFAVLLTAQSTLGYEWWNDLRVTWGALPTIGYDQLPRNVLDAFKQGWIPTSQDNSDCTNDGRFVGIRYLYPNDTGAALLFDPEGNVAGVQALIPEVQVRVPGNNYRFDLVPMIQNETILGVSYFVITAYFVHPALICESRPRQNNIGVDSQVYFQNGPNITDLKIAPKTRPEAIATGWTKNQCIPGMGWHNFFEIEKYEPTNCTQFQPTCLLFDDMDQMHGFCLLLGGYAASPRFEHPPRAGIVASLGETPECLLDQTDLIGASTIHIYFTNTPWRYLC